jgi:chorismate mutase
MSANEPSDQSSDQSSTAKFSAAKLTAVRGATTVPENSVQAIEVALTRLLQALLSENPVDGKPLTPKDMVSVFFTVTPDITAISVAKVARLSMGWHEVAMMCAQEPEVIGLPAFCIRVMIQFYGTQAPKPVYLEGATVLRPDLIP